MRAFSSKPNTPAQSMRITVVHPQELTCAVRRGVMRCVCVCCAYSDKYIDVNDDDGSLDRSRDEGEGVTVTTQIKVPAVTPENTAHVASAGQVEPPLSSDADRASTPESEGDGNVKGHPDDDPSDAAVVIVVTPESPLAATRHQPSKTQHTQAKGPRPKKAPRPFLAWFGCFGGRAVVDDHADHGDARERRLVSTKSDAGIISDNLAPAMQLDGRVSNATTNRPPPPPTTSVQHYSVLTLSREPRTQTQTHTIA